VQPLFRFPSKNVLSNLRPLPFLIGIFLIGCGIFWHFYPQDLSFSSPPAPVPTPAIAEKIETANWTFPLNIRLPELGIDLPVIPSQIVNGKWQTYSSGVSYLSASALIGQPGNSIFYGHNWPKLLGKLKQAKVGDSIIVTATGSAETKFIIQEIKTVSPDDVSILQSYSEPTLTLYTCTGILDSQRFVVIAVPLKFDPE
jgi:LPXTG-site transpeptidase (sortase) family protein